MNTIKKGIPSQEFIDALRQNPFEAPPLSDADLDLAWKKVSAVLEKKAPAKPFPMVRMVLGGLASAVAIAAVLVFAVLPASRTGGKVIAARFDSGLTLERGGKALPVSDVASFKDGDVLQNRSGGSARIGEEKSFRAILEPGGKVVLASLKTASADGQKFLLQEGAMGFQVEKRKPGEHFTVESGGVSVHVVGTLFRVEKTAEGVKVETLEGMVEVVISNAAVEKVGAEEALTVSPDGTFKRSRIAPESRSSLEALSADTAAFSRVLIKTPGVEALVYTNGSPAGLTPLAMEVPPAEKMLLELSAEGYETLRLSDIRFDRGVTLDFRMTNSDVPWKALGLSSESAHGMLVSGGSSVAISAPGGEFLYLTKTRQLLPLSGVGKNIKVPPLVLEDRSVWVSASGEVTAYDLKGGKLWSLSAPGSVWFGTKIARGGDWMALATVDRGVYIFDSKGKMVDHLDSDKAGPAYASPVLSGNGILVYVNAEGGLSAYSVSEARDLWNVSWEVTSAYPLQLGEGLAAAFFRETGEWTAYDLKDGSLVWKKTLPELQMSDPIVERVNGAFAIRKEGMSRVIFLSDRGEVSGLEFGKPIEAMGGEASGIWIAGSDREVSFYEWPGLRLKAQYRLSSRAVSISAEKASAWVMTGRGLEHLEMK